MARSYKVAATWLVIVAGLVGTNGAARAQLSGTLSADTDQSRVYVKVKSGSRLGHDHGVSGLLQSGSVNPGEGGKLVFAMRTFRTDTPDARQYVGLTEPVKPADQRKSGANMLGPEVLDVQNHPWATYEIDTFDPVEGQPAGAPGLYQLSGTFTLHGVRRPLELKAKLEPTNDPKVTRLRGAFSIRQSQFGIVPFTAVGGLVSIQDRLDIWGEFVLRDTGPKVQAATPKAKVAR
jgi:hypothetical protein